MATNQIKESTKRKVEDLPPCKYSSECYRKNPVHFLEYSHPESVKKKRVDDKAKKENEEQIVPFFLSTVQGIDHQFNEYAIGINDILSENCDELKESVQFNYMFDVEWLMKMYPHTCREKPLLLVHGHTGKDKTDLEASALRYSNIDLAQARLPIAYGTHHSKMMLLFYSSGVRVFVTTANLVEQDWCQKTQGIWKSPLFSFQDASYDIKNDTFKTDLLEYLSSYGNGKVQKYVEKLKEYDMSSANVHLIASVPGRHVGCKMHKWGHLKLRKVLLSDGPSNKYVNEMWPVIGQFSSIGSLGSDSSKWLCGEWLKSFSACKDVNAVSKASLKLIYPSIENVRNSLEGYSAGSSLPYGIQVAMKQRYLKEYLNAWLSDSVGRSLAAPHIKTYTRVSPDNKSAAWFLLTSANLSKAAWGAFEKEESQLMIRSYEVGVLFTPKRSDLTDCTFAVLGGEKGDVGSGKEFLRLPYDLPLLPYSSSDKPWVWDIRYTKEDSHGRLWIPT